MATLKRLIDITKHELFIGASSPVGIIQWFDKNEEFPKMKHKFVRGQMLPVNALVNNFKGSTSDVVEACPEDLV